MWTTLVRVAMLTAALAFSVVATACVETVRCPDGRVFDDAGECVPIPDAGAADSGPDGG